MVSILYSISAFICFCVVILLIVRIGKYMDSSNKIDIAAGRLLNRIAVFCIVDSIWGILASSCVMNSTLLFVFSTLFHLCATCAPLCWFNFVATYLGASKYDRILRITLDALWFIQVSLLIVNCFNKMLFFVNEFGEYSSTTHRYILFYLQFASYIITGIFATLRHRLSEKSSAFSTDKIKFITLLIFVAIPILTGIMQMLFPDAPAYSIGFVLGCCTLCFFVVTDIKDKNRIALLAIGITISILLIVIVYLMNQSVQHTKHTERKELMRRIANAGANIIVDNIDYGLYETGIYMDNAGHDIPLHDDLNSFWEERLSRQSFVNRTLFFVDSNNRYYSSSMESGIINTPSYYADDSDDSLCYISSLSDAGEDTNYLVIRKRIPAPIQTTFSGKAVELKYCGMLLDISKIDSSFSNSFSGQTNTIIYDPNNGAMEYIDLGLGMLLEGRNIYTKFEKVTVLYGERADEAIRKCKTGEPTVVSFKIGLEEYYFCSAPIVAGKWSVAYIIPSSEIDGLSSNSYGTVIIYIVLIAAILGVLAISLAISSFRTSIANQTVKEITALNTELERATRAKSNFLSNMSHDIRTPINGIMGMTTIALGVENNPAKTTDCLKKIDGASHHLLSLINDVLDMSRIENGKTEISIVPFDAAALYNNCCDIISGEVAAKNISLKTEMSLEHTHVRGDDLHLRQILINILGNAVKFTNNGGSIWFRCRETKLNEKTVSITFEIEDNGIGMKKEFLSKIFDAFSQDNESARSNYEGTGLGMAITKSLTKLMNGEITVTSELGKGSKFVVTIPFEIDLAACAKEDSDIAATNLNGVKILLAEDNELNMEIAVELLEDAGATITVARNGQEVIDIFNGSPENIFDVILMDIMMPVCNGLEATAKIRALDRSDAKIPIIAMTANSFSSDVQDALNAGMNAHLSKPIDIDEVIAVTARFAKHKD